MRFPTKEKDVRGRRILPRPCDILQYDLYYKIKLSRLENCELCAQKISDVFTASSEYSVIRQCYDKPADVTEAFGQ